MLEWVSLSYRNKEKQYGRDVDTAKGVLSDGGFY